MRLANPFPSLGVQRFPESTRMQVPNQVMTEEGIGAEGALIGSVIAYV